MTACVVDRGKSTDPDSGGRGNFLTIYSPQDNHSFVYMHMLKPSPALLGKQVHAGQLIGRLGAPAPAKARTSTSRSGSARQPRAPRPNRSTPCPT